MRTGRYEALLDGLPFPSELLDVTMQYDNWDPVASWRLPPPTTGDAFPQYMAVDPNFIFVAYGRHCPFTRILRPGIQIAVLNSRDRGPSFRWMSGPGIIRLVDEICDSFAASGTGSVVVLTRWGEFLQLDFKGNILRKWTVDSMDPRQCVNLKTLRVPITATSNVSNESNASTCPLLSHLAMAMTTMSREHYYSTPIGNGSRADCGMVPFVAHSPSALYRLDYTGRLQTWRRTWCLQKIHSHLEPQGVFPAFGRTGTPLPGAMSFAVVEEDILLVHLAYQPECLGQMQESDPNVIRTTNGQIRAWRHHFGVSVPPRFEPLEWELWAPGHVEVVAATGKSVFFCGQVDYTTSPGVLEVREFPAPGAPTAPTPPQDAEGE